MDLLGIKKRQFFEWIGRHRKNPMKFLIKYPKSTSNYKIEDKVESVISVR